MFETIQSFIDRNQSFILTTHDPADADGLGAELVFAAILKERGKSFRIINGSAVPTTFRFMDPNGLIEQWETEKHDGLTQKSALIVVDTSDEYHIGCMKQIIKQVKEVMVIDHHEAKAHDMLPGFIDPLSASTCEIALELAGEMGIKIQPQTAMAAYSGIVYDTGFFAYSKTRLRTFKAAIKAIESGAETHYVYTQLMENASKGALLLQKQAFATLEFHNKGRIAVMVINREDLASCGAAYEDAEAFVNMPLKVKEVEVSLMVKETPAGEVRCSLRSKGKVNVSKIAQDFGGGGHIAAAGFKSNFNLEKTLNKVLSTVEAHLDTGNT